METKLRKSVSQFFVIVPEALAARINQEALTAYLERFFPRYSFIVDLMSPFCRGDDYGLIPVAGIAGDGPNTGMFQPAPAADVMAIVDALRAFGDGARTMN